MVKKRPIADNPLEGMNITDLVRNITNGNDIPSVENDIEDTEIVSDKIVEDSKEIESNESVIVEEKKQSYVSKTISKPRKKGKPISKSFSDKIIENYLRYDKSSEKGKPIYVSNDLIVRLQEISEKYYKRLSARAIAQALIETFFNEFDGEKTIDDFMDRIHYVAPSEKELEARKVAAAKAKQARAASK